MRYEQLALALVYYLEPLSASNKAAACSTSNEPFRKKRTIIHQANILEIALRDKKIILGLKIKSDESVCSSAF